jgi:hypothetical protein
MDEGKRSQKIVRDKRRMETTSVAALDMRVFAREAMEL